MGFDEGGILLKAVVKLSQSGIGVVCEPLGLGQDELGIGQTAVLLGNVFKELDGLDEVLGRGLTCADWLRAAVKKVLLGQFHEEICIQADVELEIA